MLHYSHLRLGERYAILYRFPKRGDGLPLHSHGEDTAHTIACTRGKVRVTVKTRGATDVIEMRAGSILSSFDLRAPHEIVALEDNSSIVNEFVNDPPPSYAGLPPEALDGSAELGPLTFPLDAERIQ